MDDVAGARPRVAAAARLSRRVHGRSRALGIAAVVAAAACWAAAATVARAMFDAGLDPVQLSASRSWIAAIALALLPGSWRRPASSAGRRGIASVVLLGVSIALVNTVFYLTIQRIDVAVALVLEYTAPVLVVGWTALVGRRRPGVDIAGALVASVVGVVLVSELLTTGVRRADDLGIVLGLTTGVLFAAYTLLGQTAGASYGVQGSLFRGFAAASGYWMVVFLFRGFPAGLFEPRFIAGVLFVGLVGTVVAFLLYVWGVQQVRAERAAIAATIEPVLAGAMAWVLLGQVLAPLQLVGGALVIAAVVGLQARTRRAVLPAPP